MCNLFVTLCRTSALFSCSVVRVYWTVVSEPHVSVGLSGRCVHVIRFTTRSSAANTSYAKLSLAGTSAKPFLLA